MKKHILFLIISSLFAFIACNDDNNEGYVSSVSDVVATPNIGSIILTWTNPSEANYYYTTITYQNSMGETVKKKVSHYSVGDSEKQTKTVIGGFKDTNSYTFTLIAYNSDGAASSPVTVTASPQDANMAYYYVVNTITVNPIVQGAWVCWENEYEVPVYINIQFKDGQGKEQTKRVLSSTTDSVAIASFIDETTISITTESTKGDISNERQLNIFPKTGELSQSLMKIHSISSVWQEGCEGENMLDGNISTFWHSALNGYPHWVVFDLGGEFYVNWLELVRRQDDSGNGQWAPTEISWEYSLDGTTYTKLGTYDFDNTLVYNHTYQIKTPILARYVKLTCLQGQQAWTHMAEFLAYYGEKADHYADEAAKEITPEEPDPDDDATIEPNVEYLTFNLGTLNNMDIIQSEDNPYEYTINTTGGDPYISLNGLQNAIPGTVLVFHYQTTAAVSAEFFWCDKGGGAAGGRETFFDIPKNTSGDWKTFKLNLSDKMTQHTWAGNEGDFMRFDLGDQSGVTIKIRNIRFRAAREDE
ncbi:MAG: discoidin domain-containing protein [Massilibacteroides sp.]|nr:discoidin domain-containing protein [Massilibacteroides sp.]MDD3061888.1 discoidin domain-containing protein [Massilibacteroides sp.]MDD4115590.1 discoidin domain-containing protein [Massilibacteroides sp.]MDD4660655.1 discoidin domain-containing protein [Massilibacteroides sp.]